MSTFARVDYGTSSSLGHSLVAAIGGGGPGTWAIPLGGLQVNGTYYYRVTTGNSLGAVVSQTASFVAGAGDQGVGGTVPAAGAASGIAGAAAPVAAQRGLRVAAFHRSPHFWAVRAFGAGRPGGTFAVAARFVRGTGEPVRSGAIGCQAHVGRRQLPLYRDPRTKHVWRGFNGAWVICAWRVPQWAAGKKVRGHLALESRGVGTARKDFAFRLKRR